MDGSEYGSGHIPKRGLPAPLDLDAIKARAAQPDKVLESLSVYSDEHHTALAESQADVEPLVLEVEKLRGVAPSTPSEIPFTAEEKHRARSLLWRIEEAVYDATTERPFFDFKHEWDENDNAIVPAEPQTDAGWAAYTDILLTLREAGS